MYSIAIATFKDRYDDLFAPLLRKIACLFPDTQILVYANGHVDQEKQAEYLPRIEALCAEYGNVELFTSMEPQSLSSIWNLLIRESNAKKTFIMNDDLRVTPAFRRKITATGFFEMQVCVINNIWSHFLISRSVIDQIGWFDESLIELGGEDDDYTFRLSFAGIDLERRECYHIWNESRPSQRNSFGHDMTGEHRYSKYNAERLAKKWLISREPFPGGIWVERNRVYVARRDT